MRHIISLLMENEAGALSRVAGLFSARGYNIESLSVAPTEDPTLSRMTLYVGMVMIPEMVRQVLLKKDIAAQGNIDYRSGPFPESYNLSWVIQ